MTSTNRLDPSHLKVVQHFKEQVTVKVSEFGQTETEGETGSKPSADRLTDGRERDRTERNTSRSVSHRDRKTDR